MKKMEAGDPRRNYNWPVFMNSNTTAANCKLAIFAGCSFHAERKRQALVWLLANKNIKMSEDKMFVWIDRPDYAPGA